MEGKSQFKKPEIFFPSKEDTITKSQSLLTLRRNVDLVIAYRRYTTWNSMEPYNVIALNKNVLKSFKFSLPDLLVLQVKNTDTLRSILKLFYDYELFAMTNTDKWMETCKNSVPSCGDCNEYDFVIMVKDKVKRLYFYAPEIYVSYCPIIKENERIISLINILWK